MFGTYPDAVRWRMPDTNCRPVILVGVALLWATPTVVATYLKQCVVTVA